MNIVSIMSHAKHIHRLVDTFAHVADLVKEYMIHVECGVRLCKGGTADNQDSPFTICNYLSV
jgi:hypothetical protein